MHSKSEFNEFIIATCYVRDTDEIPGFFKKLNEAINDIKRQAGDVPIYINRDFNSRIGNLNSFIKDINLPNRNNNRISRDLTENKRGLQFCIEIAKWAILFRMAG